MQYAIFRVTLSDVILPWSNDVLHMIMFNVALNTLNCLFRPIVSNHVFQSRNFARKSHRSQSTRRKCLQQIALNWRLSYIFFNLESFMHNILTKSRFGNKLAFLLKSYLEIMSEFYDQKNWLTINWKIAAT